MNDTTITTLGPFLVALSRWAALRHVLVAMLPFTHHPEPATATALQQLLNRLDREEKVKEQDYESAGAALRIWAKETRVDAPEHVMAAARALVMVAGKTEGIVSEDTHIMASRLARYAQGLDDEED